MRNFRDIIEAWPSATAFAQDLQVNPVTARSWKRRGIPGEYWQGVVEAARTRGIAGVSYELLARMAAARRAEREAVANDGHAPTLPPADAGGNSDAKRKTETGDTVAPSERAQASREFANA